MNYKRYAENKLKTIYELKAKTSNVSSSAHAYKCQYTIWFLDILFKITDYRHV